jgi:hypothetical protein
MDKVQKSSDSVCYCTLLSNTIRLIHFSFFALEADYNVSMNTYKQTTITYNLSKK